VQGGSGFLAQHTKELFFGLAENAEAIRATIRWPSGLSQTFASLPSGHRIEIVEGTEKFEARPFNAQAPTLTGSEPAHEGVKPGPPLETWLIEPLNAPDFSLPEVSGKLVNLRAQQGSFVLLCFCGTAAPGSVEQLRSLQRRQAELLADGLKCIGINVDDA